jgi:serine/threonine-protein kinase RsbW
MIEIAKIELSSKLDNVKKIETLIDNIKNNYQLRDSVYGNVMIACIEAVTNAIEHGNNLDCKKKVNFSAFISQKSIKICVKDEGDGFNIDELDDPTLPENKLDPDGRGVYIMKNLADDIVFENKGACVNMYFNI